MIDLLPFFRRHAGFGADVFISADGGCKVALYLRKFKLRTFSSPFDWLGLYTLSDINVCFEEDSTNFFKEYEKIFSTTNKHWVRDRQNGMRSMYNSSFEESLERGYERFTTQGRRRFESLRRHIKASKHICFVSCRQDNYTEFEKFLKQMQIFHHAKYALISIRHDSNCKEMKKVELEWGGKLYFIEYLFNDTHKKGKVYKRA